MSRSSLILGNWKMHKTVDEAVSFVNELCAHLPRHSHVGIAAPALTLSALVQSAADTPLLVGAQNMHDAEEGAFTGEISAGMLQSVGANFVLLGHSERRHLFAEDSAWINRKLQRALKYKITPVVCVGETLEERMSNRTEAVLAEQLHQSLAGINASEAPLIVLAYEPVWAIGTGKTASSTQAQEVHAFIRGLLESKWGRLVAEKIPLLYGGSVRPENAQELLSQSQVDGLLVGGASLQVDLFLKIILSETAVV